MENSKKSPSAQPFWVDDPNLYFMPMVNQERVVNILIVLWSIVFFLVFCLFVTSLISAFGMSPYCFLLAVAYFVFISALTAYKIKQMRKHKSSTEEIQQKARETTGAAQIGSAVHVAGHPLLARDQPVVLALKADQLSIYRYDSPDPVDVLDLKDLQDIRTVVYDDERVPHIDVIDSASQALQLEFLWRGEKCACLFRRMINPRPIDWYDAIQKARLHP
jgi:type III secretory pathway component EscV